MTSEPSDPTRSLHAGDPAPSSEVGPYRLLAKLGEGGMGVVYRAQQVRPLRREVALKIIKPGMDSRQVIARFESERQALALMDHPHIARVFDAGATAAGLPYFVMELVMGAPITTYCDSKRLSITERIALFIPVCRAIQHAHQKGIIHRDLKPSNILVAEQESKPVAKVIDFGLVKALGPQASDASIMTNVGTVLGTLDYMSPEQADPARHDVDTRADVYSLGAVLYELLAGTTPFERKRFAEAGFLEVLRHIREEESPPPSARLRRSQASDEIAASRQSDPLRLPKLLQRELDWIVMKALEKDRGRRYETANGLARDLERYLSAEPVEAAPPSAGYRFGKFVRRHRAALAAAAACVVLLVAGAAGTLWMALRAGRAEREARAVNEFLQDDVLAQASAFKQPDPNLTVRAALDRAAASIEGKFAAQPLVEASIRHTIGSAYLDLGVYESAENQFERALLLRRRELGESNKATLETMASMAAVYERSGKFKQAESLYRQTVESLRRSAGAEHPDTLRTMNGLAVTLLEEGDTSKAMEIYERLVPMEQRVLGETDFQTLRSMGNMAGAYSVMHENAKAEALLAQTLELERKSLGPENPETLGTMDNLGIVYSDQGEYAKAEPMLAGALEGFRRVLGEGHRHTVATGTALGEMYRRRGNLAEAEALFQRVLAGARTGIGDEHPDALEAITGLAMTYEDEGRCRDADLLLSRAIEISRRVLGAEHPDTLLKTLVLGRVRLLQGRFSDAETLLRETLAGYEKSDPDDWLRYYCQGVLGASLSRQKRYAEAEPLLAGGWEGIQRRQADLAAAERKYVHMTGDEIVQLYKQWGKPDKAAEWQGKIEVAART